MRRFSKRSAGSTTNPSSLGIAAAGASGSGAARTARPDQTGAHDGVKCVGGSPTGGVGGRGRPLGRPTHTTMEDHGRQARCGQGGGSRTHRTNLLLALQSRECCGQLNTVSCLLARLCSHSPLHVTLYSSNFFLHTKWRRHPRLNTSHSPYHAPHHS